MKNLKKDNNVEEFNSDYPDKTQKCYPCHCPDCPGFHECDVYNLKHHEIYECPICDAVTQFIPFTRESIEEIASLSNREDVQEKTRERLIRSMDSGLGGEFITLKPPTRIARND